MRIQVEIYRIRLEKNRARINYSMFIDIFLALVERNYLYFAMANKYWMRKNLWQQNLGDFETGSSEQNFIINPAPAVRPGSETPVNGKLYKESYNLFKQTASA